MTPNESRTICAVALLSCCALAPAQSIDEMVREGVRQANMTLYAVRKEIRAYPEGRRCDDADWPNTAVCNSFARAAAASMRKVDETWATK